MRPSSRYSGALLALSLAVVPVSVTPIDAQQIEIKRAPSGFNVFSVQQDVELGRQSAIEAEKQLPLLNDPVTDRYLTSIIERLAAQAPGARYPYEIKAVNANEINAFALPGGPMYVNRGLLLAARSEAELAGVLAHEMSHVALRHGTEQASKSYLGQAGLGLLGGLLGERTTTSQIVSAIGGFGLNAVFLKHSRGDEYEADALGAELMSKAGYDPNAMASFFAVLRQEQGRNPSKLERFFSSHPPPANRENRIRQLASQLGGGRGQEVVGGFASIRGRLGNTAAAAEALPQWNTSTGDVAIPGATVTVNVPAPSSRFIRFTHSEGFFVIDRPENWRTYSNGLAVSLAPPGGVVEVNGRPAMVYGMIINHYEPFEAEDDRWSSSLQRSYTPFEDRNTRPRAFLEDATDDLIRHVMSANSYLTPRSNSARSGTIDGQPAYSIQLTGQSPLTGQEERVTIYTRALPDDHVIYALCVAPASHAAVAEQTCQRMVNTLQVDDSRVHRSIR